MISVFCKKIKNDNTGCNIKTLCGFFIAAVFLNGCSSAPPQISSMGNSTNKIEQPADNNSYPASQSGMNVYIDPETGDFISKPKPGQKALEITPEMQNATSTSSEGLIQEKSPISGGGVMIDLKGKFQSPLIIRQDSLGKQNIQHLNEFPKFSPRQPSDSKKGEGYEQK